MHLLYVEDNKFDQRAFHRLMKDFPDVSFDVACSQGEAASYLNENTYHAVIKDVYLQGEKSLNTLAHSNIFYVSGSRAIIDTLDKDIDMDERTFLKPLNRDDIRYIIGDSKATGGKLRYQPDMTQVDEWADGDDEFKQEMIETFLEEVPVQLRQAKTALKEGKYLEVAEKIHGMQTKIRTFGLNEINVIADRLEESAREQDIRDEQRFLAELNRIEEALDETFEILKKEAV